MIWVLGSWFSVSLHLVLSKTEIPMKPLRVIPVK